MAPNYDDNREVTFEIVEEIGVISTTATGWTKELNVVAWNGNQGKYDIREWAPRHDRMGRGITLNEQEMRQIVNLLKRRERLVPRSVSTSQSSQDSGYHDVDNGYTHAAKTGAPHPADDQAWSAASTAGEAQAQIDGFAETGSEDGFDDDPEMKSAEMAS